MYRSHVLVCGGTGCSSSNSAAIIEALEKEIEAKGLKDEVKVKFWEGLEFVATGEEKQVGKHTVLTYEREI